MCEPNSEFTNVLCAPTTCQVLMQTLQVQWCIYRLWDFRFQWGRETVIADRWERFLQLRLTRFLKCERQKKKALPRSSVLSLSQSPSSPYEPKQPWLEIIHMQSMTACENHFSQDRADYHHCCNATSDGFVTITTIILSQVFLRCTAGHVTDT